MLYKEISHMAYEVSPGLSNHCFDKCDFLKKEASAESVDYFNELKPKKDHLYFLVVAMTSGENYGCFTENNIFVSAEGKIKSVSAISKRDRVISHDNSVNLVRTPITKEWTGRFTKISARCIPDIECTSNHELFVVKKKQIKCKRDKYKRCTPSTVQNSNICFRGRGCDTSSVVLRPEFIEANKIEKGDFLSIPRGRMTKKEQVLYEPIHIDYARLVGYFMAEGSFGKNNGVISSSRFTFHAEEDIYRKEIEDISRRFGVNTTTTKVYDHDYSSTIIVNSRHISDKLFQYCGEYSTDKELSPEIFNQRDEFIKAMLGAYIDGDGHASDVDGRVTIRSSSKKMLLQIKQLLFRLGVPSSWHWNDNPKLYASSKKKTISPYGQISFSFFDAKRVFSGYSTKIDSLEFVPKAKADSKVIVTEDYIFVPVTSIETGDIETRIVYDANVERVHSYCVNFVSVHNSNRNGDYFKEEDLKKYYKIFENSGVFWNHDNKDPSKSFGKVLKSFWNQKMHRIELVIEVPTDKSRYLKDYIKEGKPISVSMGLNTPTESCSICGHVTRGSYANRCEHLKFMMNTVLHDGKKVFAISGTPLKLFDISFVFRPADRVAYAMLTKSASHKEIGLNSLKEQ